MQSVALHPEKIENPWLRAFVSEPWEEIVVAQVVIRRQEQGFELRHIDGAGEREIRPQEARELANFNSKGEFRPLKSRPDLRSGWILRASSDAELELALNYLYPNALADCFAAHQNPLPVTNYREFASRQTGMYRITTLLDDAGVARVIDRVCNSICLKCRLWSVGAVPADPANSKSIIPCLEPCAILMETARKEVRALQEKSAATGQAESATEVE